MPKLITAKRVENETELAKQYVKTHILFPSVLLGFIMLLAGAASLVYQFMVEIYGWQTFLESTGLLVAGGLVGWGQTRYHRSLLRDHPTYFASRLKTFSQASLKRAKKESAAQPPEYPGQQYVPWLYLAGVGLLLSLSLTSSIFGHVYYMAALLLPWAGFFWAKMHGWRGVLEQGTSDK
ncbi:MAG: hypothetical protein ACKOCD_05395 [Nitrospiraceae bacterium]